MNRVRCVAVLLALGAAACDTKPKTEPPIAEPAVSATALTPVTHAASTAASADRPALEDIPVPADFEEQATAQITPQSLDSEIDSLEKELNQ